MNNLSAQLQIDLAAEQLRFIMAPFTRNQQKLERDTGTLSLQ